MITYVEEQEKIVAVRIPKERCPLIRIEDGVDEASHLLNKNNRKKLLSQRERFEKSGAVSFHCDKNSRQFDDLLAIDRRSWKADERSDLVSMKHSHVLYSQFAKSAADNDWLRLFVLKYNGKPIAYNYAIVIENTAWTLKWGYDKEYATYGPGKQLMYDATNYLLQEKVRMIDLWGRADPYKMRWANSYVSRSDYWLFPNTVYGRVRAGIFASRENLCEVTVPQSLYREPKRNRFWQKMDGTDFLSK